MRNITLTKLSASIESTVSYKNPPANIDDSELLKLATEHEPMLLKPFENYMIRILKDNRHAVVLVCSKNGTYGLLEDAGCSAPLDKHLWQMPKTPCDFTFSIKDVCNK